MVNRLSKNIITSFDHKDLIALGLAGDVTPVSKFGLNESLSASLETVWDKGGLYVYLDSPQFLDISSTDVDDNETGSGARTIQIQGLNSDYNILNETVILDGQNIKTTQNKFIRVFRMRIATAGISGGAEGEISAKFGAITYAQIVNGNNQTLMALYTVPVGYTALMDFGKASASKGKDVRVSFFARPFGGVFNLQHKFYLFESNYDFAFTTPLLMTEKTDLEVRAVSDATGTGISAAFNLKLFKNSEWGIS